MSIFDSDVAIDSDQHDRLEKKLRSTLRIQSLFETKMLQDFKKEVNPQIGNNYFFGANYQDSDFSDLVNNLKEFTEFFFVPSNMVLSIHGKYSLEDMKKIVLDKARNIVSQAAKTKFLKYSKSEPGVIEEDPKTFEQIKKEKKEIFAIDKLFTRQLRAKNRIRGHTTFRRRRFDQLLFAVVFQLMLKKSIPSKPS